MSDRYRLPGGAPGAAPSARPQRVGPAPARAQAGPHPVRVLLWVLIVVTAAANAITSLGGFPALVSAGFGLLSVTCIVLLVIHHLRGRR